MSDPVYDDQLVLGYNQSSAELREKIQRIARDMLMEDAVRGGDPSHGVTFDQVRIHAETRGILTGEEQGRTLSFGSGLMKAAGGVAGEYRTSRHPKSNRRKVRVFRLDIKVVLR